MWPEPLSGLQETDYRKTEGLKCQSSMCRGANDCGLEAKSGSSAKTLGEASLSCLDDALWVPGRWRWSAPCQLHIVFTLIEWHFSPWSETWHSKRSKGRHPPGVKCSQTVQSWRRKDSFCFMLLKFWCSDYAFLMKGWLWPCLHFSHKRTEKKHS